MENDPGSRDAGSAKGDTKTGTGGISARDAVKAELEQYTDPVKAKHHYTFFKAFPGGYGEGDEFIGAKVPDQRKVAKKFWGTAGPADISALLAEPVHEYRLTAIFMLVYKYQKADAAGREKIARFYLDHLDRVNNWDLVDSSAEKILGPYLFQYGGHRDAGSPAAGRNKEQQLDRQVLTRTILYRLAESGELWKQRVAMIACYYFIKQHDFEDALNIAELLVDHPRDIIHKAVGWMLREIGNRDKDREVAFLENHAGTMPRTMLRYAIEKFPPDERKQWLGR